VLVSVPVEFLAGNGRQRLAANVIDMRECFRPDFSMSHSTERIAVVFNIKILVS
jgi:hypothetical protein